MSHFGDYDHLVEVFGEIHDKNDRAAALAAGSFLEDQLSFALNARFIPLSETRKDALYKRPDAPLRTFSAKIELGFALALYGEATRIDLEHIRKIRNEYAHNAAKRSFDTPKISERCDALSTPSRINATMGLLTYDFSNPRDRYVATICQIAAELTFEVSNPLEPRTLP
jgi:hypothetical protein